MNSIIEMKFAKFLALGLFLITILVLAGPATDPVNAPKHLLLGIISFGLLPYLFLQRNLLLSKDRLKVTLVSLSFLLFLLSSTIFSSSPLTQNLYGTYGRNTGLITFIGFTLVFLTISNFSSIKSLNFIIFSFGAAGAFNITYSLIYKFIGDPFPWNNIYNAFLGTFGNPNFSGAFCGIILSIYLSYLLSIKSNIRFQFVLFLLVAGSAFAVFTSKTTQGILVSGISVFIVLFIYISKVFRNKLLTTSFVLSASVISIFTILGMLQFGPFSQYVYKETVSLRGSYWTAALNAGNENVLTGIGLDTLGDWYRRARSIKAATWLPGPDVITNSAHNYYLDIYASGGIFLLLAYFGFTVIGIISSIKIYRKIKAFDPIASLLVATFFSFQAQAIISIPQIGIAVWGWAIIGMLVCYARILEEADSKTISKLKKTNPQDLPIGVLIFVAGSIGVLVAVPPFSADTKWMSATKSQKLENVEAALKTNYFNPPNGSKYINAISLMENNKFYVESHKYALKAIEFNPDFYEAWRALYFATNSTASERQLALSNMRRLDPLNKRLEKLK